MLDYFSPFSQSNRRNDLNNNEHDWLDIDYSSGDSDSEYTHMFAYLSTEQKTKRLLHLWARVYTKSKAANLLYQKYKDLV